MENLAQLVDKPLLDQENVERAIEAVLKRRRDARCCLITPRFYFKVVCVFAIAVSLGMVSNALAVAVFRTASLGDVVSHTTHAVGVAVFCGEFAPILNHTPNLIDNLGNITRRFVASELYTIIYADDPLAMQHRDLVSTTMELTIEDMLTTLSETCEPFRKSRYQISK